MPTRSIRLPAEADLGLTELSNAAGLRVALLPNGAIYTIEHDGVMVPHTLGDPLFGRRDGVELWLRDVPAPPDGALGQSIARIDGREAERCDVKDAGIIWTRETSAGLRSHVRLRLHPTLPALVWSIRLSNATDTPVHARPIWTLGTGLTSRFMARLNERYAAQYLDLRGLTHPTLGHILAARQALEVDGRNPGALAFAQPAARAAFTDELDGHEWRSGMLSPLRDLPDGINRRQHESAAFGFVGAEQTVAADASADWTFALLLRPDQPQPTREDDAALLNDLAHWINNDLDREPRNFESADHPRRQPRANLPIFAPPPRIGGDGVSPISRNRPGRDGFDDHGRYIVPFATPDPRYRPAAHVMRTGPGVLPDVSHLCVTCGRHGVFLSHVALGNTSFGKLLSVARDPSGQWLAGGLRIAIDGVAALGTPSRFIIEPQRCTWEYDGVGNPARDVVVTVEADSKEPTLRFNLAITSGPPAAFTLIAQTVLGNHEYDQPGHLDLDDDAGRAVLRFDKSSLFASQHPDAHFVWAFDDASTKLDDGRPLSPREGLIAAPVQDAVPPAPVFTAITAEPVPKWSWSITGMLDNEAATNTITTPTAFNRTIFGLAVPTLEHDAPAIGRLNEVLPWFTHNAVIHLSSPHGLEQNSGAAWGTRDVCQGPVELLAALDRYDAVRAILITVFTNQFAPQGDGFGGHFPQWFMLPPFGTIRPAEAHGDVVVWPLKALADYLLATGDASILDEPLPYIQADAHTPTTHTAPLRDHVAAALDHIEAQTVPGTALPRLGEGDWNDALQAADHALQEQLVSGWTAALLYQTLSRLGDALRGLNREAVLVRRMTTRAGAIARDYQRHVVHHGQAAGFVRFENARPVEWLLHPADTRTGIHHRLLPMNRGVLSGLFSPDQAEHHVQLIEQHLLAPDGARLMTRPPRYDGGAMHTFKRAESAAFFGREVGLMYTHAHLRYAELRAELGHGEALLDALNRVNPVGIEQSVKNALPRQQNAYFSSSDAAFAHRDEADEQYPKVMTGGVGVEGGWRVYSSGPGIFVGLLVQRVLGLRREARHLVVDPVLPAACDGLVATVPLMGRLIRVTYRATGKLGASTAGRTLPVAGRTANPYRAGGLRIPIEAVDGDALDVTY